MRRLLSIALMLVLVMPLVASVLEARAQSVSLPACCRRNGSHHCMELASMASASSKPAVHAVCPAFPHATASVQTSVWNHSAVPQSEARLEARPTAVAQAEAGYRIASTRSRHKRGPPVWNS